MTQTNASPYNQYEQALSPVIIHRSGSTENPSEKDDGHFDLNIPNQTQEPKLRITSNNLFQNLRSENSNRQLELKVKKDEMSGHVINIHNDIVTCLMTPTNCREIEVNLPIVLFDFTPSYGIPIILSISSDNKTKRYNVKLGNVEMPPDIQDELETILKSL